MLATCGASIAKVTMLSKFLVYLVILLFEKRCLQQNTDARLKSKHLAQKLFRLTTFLGASTHSLVLNWWTCKVCKGGSSMY